MTIGGDSFELLNLVLQVSFSYNKVTTVGSRKVFIEVLTLTETF